GGAARRRTARHPNAARACGVAPVSADGGTADRPPHRTLAVPTPWPPTWGRTAASPVRIR
ncbi:hypothetical protein ACWDWV_37680, partial [Streptosporangium sandarakinum]